MIHIWNTATGELIQKLQHHTNQTWGIAWSPDGGIFVTGSLDRTVAYWDASSYTLIRSIPHPHAVYSASWSPDGNYLSTRINRGFIITDMNTGETVHRIESHPQAVRMQAWSPKGDLIAAVDEAGLTILWDPVIGNEKTRFEGHTSSV